MAVPCSRCLAASVLLLGLSLVSCQKEEDRIVEQTFERTCKVNPNARISIKNLEGSIHIYGSGTNEVHIEAIKQAYQRDRLEKIAINVAAQPDSVSIDTSFPPKPKLGLSDRSGTVDYFIVVPQSCTISRLDLGNGEVVIEGMRVGRVNANLVNGRLYERNCFGPHQLFVANGAIDFTYDWWEAGKFSIDATIVHGNARAFIPGDASFQLLACTDNGKISSDFSAGEEGRSGRSQKLDTIVGDSSSIVLKIHATNGNIQVAEANP